jgi:hypothetical protein
MTVRTSATHAIPGRDSHCVITDEDTVTVRGESGCWVVGAVRPANPFSYAADQRVPAVLVTCTIGRREITSISMWIPTERITMVRKGNAVGDVLARDHGIRPAPLRYGIGCTTDGWVNGNVYDFGA